MASARENLLDWLRDAHAMEQQAETMLSTTASRIKNYPEMKARLEQHAEEVAEICRWAAEHAPAAELDQP